MTTLLPKDADNNIIPALRLRDSGAHSLNVGGSSVRNIIPFSDETKIISVYASAPIFLKFGDESVAAASSDHYFPGGVYYDIALTGGNGKGAHHAYVSALRAEGDCTLYISEKE